PHDAGVGRYVDLDGAGHGESAVGLSEARTVHDVPPATQIPSPACGGGLGWGAHSTVASEVHSIFEETLQCDIARFPPPPPPPPARGGGSFFAKSCGASRVVVPSALPRCAAGDPRMRWPPPRAARPCV